MGEPIKVGTHFGDFNKWTMAIANHFEKQGEGTDRFWGYYTGKCNVQMNEGDRNIMHGNCVGKKAYLYVNWCNDTESIYTNEYKPSYKRQIDNEKEGNLAFTTIYDWGYDSKNECPYYYKAEDKNGNGVVDEGEITKYDNIKELFNKGF